MRASKTENRFEIGFQKPKSGLSTLGNLEKVVCGSILVTYVYTDLTPISMSPRKQQPSLRLRKLL